MTFPFSCNISFRQKNGETKKTSNFWRSFFAQNNGHFLSKQAKSYLAQRCGGVAEGQTKGGTKCSLQGRADLRAPQHSGGRARQSLAGRGPQNLTKMILLILFFAPIKTQSQ